MDKETGSECASCFCNIKLRDSESILIHKISQNLPVWISPKRGVCDSGHLNWVMWTKVTKTSVQICSIYCSSALKTAVKTRAKYNKDKQWKKKCMDVWDCVFFRMTVWWCRRALQRPMQDKECKVSAAADSHSLAWSSEPAVQRKYKCWLCVTRAHSTCICPYFLYLECNNMAYWPVSL